MAKTILICRRFFSSRTLVPDEDALIVLEAQFASDRMRRMLYNRLESIAMWHRIPWVFILVTGGIPAASSAILFSINGMEEVSLIIACCLLALAAILTGIGLYWKRTYLAITRDGETKTFSAFVSPRARKRFLRLLNNNIRNYQQAHQPQTAAPASELEPQIDLDLGPSATATSDPPIEPDLDPPAPD